LKAINLTFEVLNSLFEVLNLYFRGENLALEDLFEARMGRNSSIRHPHLKRDPETEGTNRSIAPSFGYLFELKTRPFSIRKTPFLRGKRDALEGNLIEKKPPK
jgi:hypothetical protein